MDRFARLLASYNCENNIKKPASARTRVREQLDDVVAPPVFIIFVVPFIPVDPKESSGQL